MESTLGQLTLTCMRTLMQSRFEMLPYSTLHVVGWALLELLVCMFRILLCPRRMVRHQRALSTLNLVL